jgi:D-alanine-D-alanine ligase
VISADRTRLVVLFGGRSAEHEISCISALHLLRNIDRSRYDVVPIGITRDGRWIESNWVVAAVAGGADELPSPDFSEGAPLHPLSALLPPGTDPNDTVVFPLLHGPMGEDGTVQGLLELAGVAYIGAGVMAAATTMHKAVCKEILGAHGIPQPRWLSARETEVGEVFRGRVADELGFPCFVKPANLGSSIGITKVHQADDLQEAIEVALRFDDYIVVEENIVCRELMVGVLGNTRPRASVPGEIVPSHEFYDYTDKYLKDDSRFLLPAPLGERETEAVRQLALRAYTALRMDGMARVDFFYIEDEGTFLVNELNAVPGFRSVFPGLWEATGLSRTDLLHELVRLARERRARRDLFETKR